MKGSIIFLTMLFFSALYTYLVGAQTSMLLAYMFVLCIPVSFFLTWPLRKRFEISLEMPSFEVEKGGVIKMNILLRNKSFLPVPFVGIRFLAADNLVMQEDSAGTLSFSPHEAKSITIRYYALHRGVADLGLNKLFVKDYLGLFSFSLLKGLEAHEYAVRVTVLPKITVMRPSSKILHGSDGREKTMSEAESVDAGTHFLIGEPGHEFREYQAGDPLHKVHWKLSAKTGRLMVRKSESGGASKLCFILDPFLMAETDKPLKKKRSLITGNTPAKCRDEEEKLLEALLSVANMVIRLGRHAEVWLYDQEQWQVKSISQKKDLNELQRHLAQYRFSAAHPESGSNRLPISSMVQQQKMNRSYKGGDAILFTAAYDQPLQKLLQSSDLKSMTLRIIRIQPKQPADAQGDEPFAASAKGFLWTLNPDENLSDAVI